MNIIGFSGFENAMSFKERELPGLRVSEYRIVQGQDSAAALIVDGKIKAAAAEERFNGRKHSGAFPAGAIQYCTATAGIDLDSVDAFVHSYDYAPYKNYFSINDFSRSRYKEVYSRNAVLERFHSAFPSIVDIEQRLYHVEHHLAHAASAYYTSGWDECLVVVLDGMGEVHSITVWHGRDGQLECIHKQSAENSIGILYSLITLHLGFDFNSDEYKIMGLAPYGNPDRYLSFFDENVKLLNDGSIQIPILGLNKTPAEREIYSRTRAYIAENLIPERDPKDEISDQHRDVAAALQKCLNRSIQHICSSFSQQTGLRRLAMAGGVALNCTANGKLLYSGQFEDIYVQPASGDDGVALGAALAYGAAHSKLDSQRMAIPYFGPSYSSGQIKPVLTKFADHIDVTHFDSPAETCAAAARCIADGQVVAWCRGRMEFGPRALGNRSILANPADPAMRDRVNAMVKMREAFRPFAPAVSLETVHEWFEVEPGTELPHMIIIVNVREEHRTGLPAITHVDGTARVQTVSEASNKVFHQLLKEVGKTTGKEMVLNTSFNVKGQPMVNTPEEAVETFLGTGIDVLFLEDTLVRKRKK